jgi:alkyl hydroperoxide reductase subunit AhpF
VVVDAVDISAKKSLDLMSVVIERENMLKATKQVIANGGRRWRRQDVGGRSPLLSPQ